MGCPPGPHTPTYPLNTTSTFGAMPEDHYFEADDHKGGFVKHGALASPARIGLGVQEVPDAEPVLMDPATPVRYFNGQR